MYLDDIIQYQKSKKSVLIGFEGSKNMEYIIYIYTYIRAFVYIVNIANTVKGKYNIGNMIFDRSMSKLCGRLL